MAAPRDDSAQWRPGSPKRPAGEPGATLLNRIRVGGIRRGPPARWGCVIPHSAPVLGFFPRRLHLHAVFLGVGWSNCGDHLERALSGADPARAAAVGLVGAISGIERLVETGADINVALRLGHHLVQQRLYTRIWRKRRRINLL